jgi:hypothetical protein
MEVALKGAGYQKRCGQKLGIRELAVRLIFSGNVKKEVFNNVVYCYELLCHGSCCYGGVVTLKRAKANGRTGMFCCMQYLAT